MLTVFLSSLSDDRNLFHDLSSNKNSNTFILGAKIRNIKKLLFAVNSTVNTLALSSPEYDPWYINNYILSFNTLNQLSHYYYYFNTNYC